MCPTNALLTATFRSLNQICPQANPMPANTVNLSRRRRRSLPHMLQSPIDKPTIELELEDFRRLGVRPFEYRLSVIRQAVARSSRPLAKKQLASPSPQSSLQLSRVATSAYRVLDPRQRVDTHQRVCVGRILPNALIWAGRTSFCDSVTEPESESESVVIPFTRRDSGDDALIEIPTIETSPIPSQLNEGWEQTLQDQDLLNTTPMAKRLSRLQMQSKHPLVLLSVVGLILGTLLGLATLMPNENALTKVRNDSIPDGETASGAEAINNSTVIIKPNRTPPDDNMLPGRDQVRDPGTAELSVTVPLDLDVLFPSEVEADTMNLTPSENPANGDSTNENLANENSEKTAPMMSAPTNQDSPYLADPFVGLTQAPEKQSPPAEKDVARDPVMIETPKTLPAESSAPESTKLAEPTKLAESRYPIPEQESVRAAKTRLMELIPELATLTPLDDVTDQIKKIAAIEDDLQEGSVDRWTARLMIAEFAWTIENLDAVAERLRPLLRFETAEALPLTYSFVAACDRAHLPETHSHLLSVGLQLADRLLMSESYPECEQVVEAIRPSAKFLGSNSSRDYLEQFLEAAEHMSRSTATVQRILDEEGQIGLDAKSVGTAGRHYCLMLRQWQRGLPWLVKVSNSRIASLARQELELNENADADDLFQLAQRWDTLASRSTRRAADSMRLHAIELMRLAGAKSTGLKKLEIERLIDESLVSLPPFLK